CKKSKGLGEEYVNYRGKNHRNSDGSQEGVFFTRFFFIISQVKAVIGPPISIFGIINNPHINERQGYRHQFLLKEVLTKHLHKVKVKNRHHNWPYDRQIRQ